MVSGQPVHRAIGYRDGRIWPASSNPVAFRDARTLGRPLCCRPLPSASIELRTLLSLVDVQLPDNLVLQCVGGEASRHSPTCRTFTRCCTVILWAYDARPPTAVTRDDGDDADLDDSPHSPDPDSDSDCGDGGRNSPAPVLDSAQEPFSQLSKKPSGTEGQTTTGVSYLLFMVLLPRLASPILTLVALQGALCLPHVVEGETIG